MRHHRSGRARPRGLTAGVLALVAALPLLVGCEPEETGARDMNTGDAGAGRTAPAERGPDPSTRTVTTELFASGDIRPGLDVAEEVSGRCEPSTLSPGNELARRCFTNETTLAMDPCFVPERPSADALSQGETQQRSVTDQRVRDNPVETIAACVRDPASEEVTKVYVRDDDAPFVPREAHAAWWFVELADGTRCVKVMGAPAIQENLHLSYRCEDGFLYGIPDETERIWTIHHRESDSDDLTLARIRTAWS